MFRHFLKPVKKFRKSYLPGIVSASSDDDPSGVSTYSVAGATTGFSQLWLLLVSTPIIIAICAMAARIGDVTKKGIITLVRENFGRATAFFLLVTFLITNALILVADIVGMAAGFQLLTGESYIYFIIPVIILIWYIVVFDNYKHIARYFFWLSGFLVAYIISGILAKPDWLAILKATFIPHIDFSLTYAMAGLALLGTTLSPYVFFWQTQEEIEEKRTVKNLSQSNVGVSLGFIYSNLIAFFIMIASAKVIMEGSLNLLTVKDIAQALSPLAGTRATILFGVGLIGSGLLAIPVLAASSAYAVAEFFSWPEGLNRKPKRARGFYSVITAGFILCLVSLFLNLHPVKIIFYSQVIVGVLTPILIYYMLRVARSKKIMGAYRCGFLTNFIAWTAIVILVLGNIFLFYYLFGLG